MHDRCDGCARPLALSNHPYQRCRIARRLADASTLQVARPPQQTARRIVPPFAKLLGRLSARTPRGDPGGPLRCSRHARQRATRGAFLLHGSVNRIRAFAFTSHRLGRARPKLTLQGYNGTFRRCPKLDAKFVDTLSPCEAERGRSKVFPSRTAATPADADRLVSGTLGRPVQRDVPLTLSQGRCQPGRAGSVRG